MSNEAIKRYFEKVSEDEGAVSSPDEEIVIDPDEYMEGELDDGFELDGEAEDTHVAGLGENAGEHGLVHEDGTKCDAQKEENCPEEARAAKADSSILGGNAKTGQPKKLRKVMTTETMRLRAKRRQDSEYAALEKVRRKLYRKVYEAKKVGDKETVEKSMKELEGLRVDRGSSRRGKERYEHRKEREASLPKEERETRYRLKVVNQELRQALNAERIEQLTKERDVLRKKLDEMMDRRGSRVRHSELPHKTLALHSKKWNQLQNRIRELSSRSMYAAKHPEAKGVELTKAEEDELEKARHDFEVEGAREKLELNENERRGMQQYRVYLGWGKRIVVKWHSGRWLLAPEKMDAKDYEFVKAKMLPKKVEVSEAKKERIREIAVETARRIRAKKMGVSLRFLKIVGEAFKEDTGAKVVTGKTFLEWCAKKGIKVESWEEGQRREYLRLVGGDAA